MLLFITAVISVFVSFRFVIVIAIFNPLISDNILFLLLMTFLSSQKYVVDLILKIYPKRVVRYVDGITMMATICTICFAFIAHTFASKYRKSFSFNPLNRVKIVLSNEFYVKAVTQFTDYYYFQRSFKHEYFLNLSQQRSFVCYINVE